MKENSRKTIFEHIISSFEIKDFKRFRAYLIYKEINSTIIEYYDDFILRKSLPIHTNKNKFTFILSQQAENYLITKMVEATNTLKTNLLLYSYKETKNYTLFHKTYPKESEFDFNYNPDYLDLYYKQHLYSNVHTYAHNNQQDFNDIFFKLIDSASKLDSFTVIRNGVNILFNTSQFSETFSIEQIHALRLKLQHYANQLNLERPIEQLLYYTTHLLIAPSLEYYQNLTTVLFLNYKFFNVMDCTKACALLFMNSGQYSRSIEEYYQILYIWVSKTIHAGQSVPHNLIFYLLKSAQAINCSDEIILFLEPHLKKIALNQDDYYLSQSLILFHKSDFKGALKTCRYINTKDIGIYISVLFTELSCHLMLDDFNLLEQKIVNLKNYLQQHSNELNKELSEKYQFILNLLTLYNRQKINTLKQKIRSISYKSDWSGFVTLLKQKIKI